MVGKVVPGAQDPRLDLLLEVGDQLGVAGVGPDLLDAAAPQLPQTRDLRRLAREAADAEDLHSLGGVARVRRPGASCETTWASWFTISKPKRSPSRR